MRITSLRATARLLMLGIVLFSAGGHQARAQEPFFPDLVFFPRDKDLNSIVEQMTSVHLRAMKEPSLWSLARKDRTAEVCRFLWLASNEHPICLRLTRNGRSFVLHVAGHDGPPGMTAGRLTLNKDVKLSVPQGERLVGQLGRTAFWRSPVEVKESRGIADGDRIVIEGVRGGRYHVIVRAGSKTGESYKAFCRSLLELAGEPGVLKAWDRFRQSERREPGYRPEPPQTEDRGDAEPDAEAPATGSPPKDDRDDHEPFDQGEPRAAGGRPEGSGRAGSMASRVRPA